MLSQRAASSPAVRTGFAALAALALVAACSQPADNTANSTNDAAADAGQRYEAAPELQGAKLAKGGAMELDGSANPGVAVRLATPGGATQFATADAQGHWRMTLAPSGSPRLFGLSMLAGARVVQAMGYIFVAPDGAVADRTGRFTLPLNEPLDAGAHGFDLTSASGEQQFAVTIDTPQPLTQGPFVAARQGRAWRIDWRTPGGGEQTTLVLDQAGPGA
jgi:hypothetical protein